MVAGPRIVAPGAGATEDGEAPEAPGAPPTPSVARVLRPGGTRGTSGSPSTVGPSQRTRERGLTRGGPFTAPAFSAPPVGDPGAAGEVASTEARTGF